METKPTKKMAVEGGVYTTCKGCGRRFWESFPGARANSGEFGEDLCDDCEGDRLCARGEHDSTFTAGKCDHCDADVPEPGKARTDGGES